MAIKKNEAGILTEEDLAEVSKLEAAIDKRIKDCYLADETKKTVVGFLGFANNRVRQEIAKRYREAGWQAKISYHGDDQRDGGYAVELS